MSRVKIILCPSCGVVDWTPSNINAGMNVCDNCEEEYNPEENVWVSVEFVEKVIANLREEFRG